MVDQPQLAGQGVLVFHRLDATPAPEAARLDLASGLLTPAQTTWRHRPVVMDHKAYAHVQGRRNGVDLVVDRGNGWRVAKVPLYEKTTGGAVVAPPEVLDRLADAINRFGPHGALDAVGLLRMQSQYLAYRGAPPQKSPLADRVAGRFDFLDRLNFF